MRIWPSKRRWKQLAIGLLGVVALLALADGFMVWRTESRLAAKIAEIRAAGDPASIADLEPTPIPADQNAAAIIQRLGPRLDEFAKDHVRFLDRTPLGTSYAQHRDRGDPPTPEEIEAIRAILDKYPDLDAGLETVAACDNYASVADFSLASQQFLEENLKNQAGKIRTPARFLDWRIEVLTANGQTEEAAKRGLQLLRISRLYDREPLLVNMLVGIALRGTAANALYDALASGKVPPDLHAAIDQELALHDDPRRMGKMLRTERAYSVSTAIDSGCMPAKDDVNPLWLRIVGWPMKRHYVNALGAFDDQLIQADRPWYEAHGQVGFQSNLLKKSEFGTLADLLLPAIQAAYEYKERMTATLRALRIFNALAQYRDEHGREASGLEELNLPKEATIDPFSGDPLKLEHTPDGWIVYSVMQNGVDDGGDFRELKDYGLAPAKHRATE
jgi:hypothetical protein